MKKVVLKKSNPIHVKFHYSEALHAKKIILETEMGLINAIRYMNRYRKLRGEETKLKLRLKKELKEVGDKIKIINQLMPQIEIYDKNPFLTKEHDGKKIALAHKKKPEKNSLETELEEIRFKLDSLAQKGA